MASDNEDFPFTFGATSDSEDQDDDGLFCPPKTTTATSTKTSSSSSRNATISILKEQERYVAQIDENGWFLRLGKSVRDLMLQDKNGATKVKMQADYSYMLHRYQEAFNIAEEYCHIVAENEAGLTLPGNVTSSGDGGMQRSDSIATDSGDGGDGGSILKVTDSKDMQEMMVRCLLKLDRPNKAAVIADGLISQDTSIIFLKAKVYSTVGRFRDAAVCLLDYQKSRSSNYAVWKALGDCFHEASIRSANSGPSSSSSISSETTSPTTIADSLSAVSVSSFSNSDHLLPMLALICVLRARHLMRVSIWSQVSYAQSRYDQEMQVIESQRSDYERACGLPSFIENDALRIQEYEAKVVTPSREALRTLQATVSGDYNRFFPLEVINIVISSWDPQLIESSASKVPAEDENQATEPSVRSK